MSNNSGLKPLGRALLVEIDDPNAKRMEEAGLVIPDNVRTSTASIETRARVLDIGESCWPDEPPRCKIGDLVLIAKMAGVLAIGPSDGKQYRFINDRDVFALITDEEGAYV